MRALSSGPDLIRSCRVETFVEPTRGLVGVQERLQQTTSRRCFLNRDHPTASGVFRPQGFWYRGSWQKSGQRFAVCGGLGVPQTPRRSGSLTFACEKPRGLAVWLENPRVDRHRHGQARERRLSKMLRSCGARISPQRLRCEELTRATDLWPVVIDLRRRSGGHSRAR